MTQRLSVLSEVKDLGEKHIRKCAMKGYAETVCSPGKKDIPYATCYDLRLHNIVINDIKMSFFVILLWVLFQLGTRDMQASQNYSG